MVDISRLGAFDDTPIYTIKTVVHLTGITPATLRAWERRYGVLAPGRSEGGYRLYSERDIATLRWLKHQVDAGVTISRAVALLDIHHQAGEQPELEEGPVLLPGTSSSVTAEEIRSAHTISENLLEALLAYRERDGKALLDEAFALHPVEQVLELIIAPALTQVGDRWHRGEATIGQEHFATAFLRRRLTALLDVYDNAPGGPLAITGSAPGEWHDVGILVISVVLRRRGWRVLYLGQSLPAEALVEAARKNQPRLICLSATMRESAERLVEVTASLSELPEPRPQLALGGLAFDANPQLRLLFPDAQFATSAAELRTRPPGR